MRVPSTLHAYGMIVLVVTDAPTDATRAAELLQLDSNLLRSPTDHEENCIMKAVRDLYDLRITVDVVQYVKLKARGTAPKLAVRPSMDGSAGASAIMCRRATLHAAAMLTFVTQTIKRVQG